MNLTPEQASQLWKIDALMRKHETRLAQAYRELDTNFDMRARDIIAMACADMGISRKEWDAIQSHRCAQATEEREP